MARGSSGPHVQTNESDRNDVGKPWTDRAAEHAPCGELQHIANLDRNHARQDSSGGKLRSTGSASAAVRICSMLLMHRARTLIPQRERNSDAPDGWLMRRLVRRNNTTLRWRKNWPPRFGRRRVQDFRRLLNDLCRVDKTVSP